MWSRNTATASHNLHPRTKGLLSEIMLIADKSGPGINLTTLLGPIYSSILLLIQLRIQIFYSADMAPDPCCFKIFLGRASFHLNACLLFKLQQLVTRARRRFFKNKLQALWFLLFGDIKGENVSRPFQAIINDIKYLLPKSVVTKFPSNFLCVCVGGGS